MDLRAANNARIDVQGVEDTTISLLSPSGERFKTSSKIYIVRNVSEVYLSLDVLVGLRIVNEFFPAAGAGNQHGAQAGAWDRTGTVTEQLPHASYSLQSTGPEESNKLANTFDDSTPTTSTQPHTRLAVTLLLAAKGTVPVLQS